MFLNGGTDHTLSLRPAVFDGFCFKGWIVSAKEHPRLSWRTTHFYTAYIALGFSFFFSSQSVNIFFRGPQLSCVNHRDSSAQQKEVEKYVTDDLESAYTHTHTHTSYTYIHTLTTHPNSLSNMNKTGQSCSLNAHKTFYTNSKGEIWLQSRGFYNIKGIVWHFLSWWGLDEDQHHSHICQLA